MPTIVIWAMILWGGNPSPHIMAVWDDGDAEYTCRSYINRYNLHHSAPLHAECVKYIQSKE